MRYLSWSFIVFQRSFSWQWYIALTVNWVWCTLTRSLFSCFLGQLLSLMYTQNHSFKYVCLCDTTSVSPLPSFIRPSSQSLASATPQALMPSFVDNCSYLFQDVTRIRYQYEMVATSKSLACWEITSYFFFFYISQLFPTHFSCAVLSLTEHRRLPKYQSSQLSHFHSVVVSHWTPWQRWLRQAAAVSKLWKVSQKFSLLPWQ